MKKLKYEKDYLIDLKDNLGRFYKSRLNLRVCLVEMGSLKFNYKHNLMGLCIRCKIIIASRNFWNTNNDRKLELRNYR